MRIAMLTPAPDYRVAWNWAFDVQARALREAGAEVMALPWTEARALGGFDLILPLVTWGYHLRHAEWLSFLDGLEASGAPVRNPPSVLRWNSDKVYLTELAARDVPTVPTLAVDHLNEAALTAAHGVLGSDRLVIKPPVSASAWGTYQLGPGEPVPEDVHGRPMLVQPWLPAVTEEGEYSLIFFAGRFSHSVVKRPKRGDYRVQPEHGGSTEAVAAPEGALAIAEAALLAGPAATTYARVDLIRGLQGTLQVMELELIEPALFLHCEPEAEARFASAILGSV
jgi:glutathione synthase/RimK-type ligase-like ATP-grasp enzyme